MYRVRIHEKLWMECDTPEEAVALTDALLDLPAGELAIDGKPVDVEEHEPEPMRTEEAELAAVDDTDAEVLEPPNPPAPKVRLCKSGKAALADRVLALLKDTPAGLTISEIAERLEAKRGSVSTHMCVFKANYFRIGTRFGSNVYFHPDYEQQARYEEEHRYDYLEEPSELEEVSPVEPASEIEPPPQEEQPAEPEPVKPAYTKPAKSWTLPKKTKPAGDLKSQLTSLLEADQPLPLASISKALKIGLKETFDLLQCDDFESQSDGYVLTAAINSPQGVRRRGADGVMPAVVQGF